PPPPSGPWQKTALPLLLPRQHRHPTASAALSSSLGPLERAAASPSLGRCRKDNGFRRPSPPPSGRRNQRRCLSSSLGTAAPFAGPDGPSSFGGPFLLPRAGGTRRRCLSSSLGIAAPFLSPRCAR